MVVNIKLVSGALFRLLLRVALLKLGYIFSLFFLYLVFLVLFVL